MKRTKKHNKKRNTAFLYEALVKEVAKSVIEKDLQRKGLLVSIIKEHFNVQTHLGKELQLYRALASSEDMEVNVAEKLIQEAKKEHQKIDKKKLFVEQSRVISKINKTLSRDVFSNFVPNYKNLATISQIFNDDITIKNKVLLEAELLKVMTSETNKSENKLPVSNLVYRTFLKQFNETYGNELMQEQKSLLQNYILSFNDNGLQFKIYLNEELGRLKKVILKALKVEEIKSDGLMKEKTKTVLGLIENFKNKPFNKNMLTQVLKMQSLVKEIQN